MPVCGHVHDRFERLTNKAPDFAGGYLLEIHTQVRLCVAQDYCIFPMFHLYHKACRGNADNLVGKQNSECPPAIPG